MIMEALDMYERKEDFGNKIKLLRKKNNMTQYDLANKLNVTRQAISNWERGQTTPDIDTIDKISKLFAITIDQMITGEERVIEKQYDRKLTKILYIASVFIVILNVILQQFILHQMKSNIIISFILLITETTIYFTFDNAVINDDFSIIAGYDSKTQYNKPIFKKMLMSIENHIMISTFSFLVIIAVTGFFSTPKALMGILLFIYVIELVVSILIINLRNREDLLINKQDKQMAGLSNVVTIVFILLILASVGVMLISKEYNDIKNNTPEAIKLIGFLFPSVILATIGLAYEQYRIKKFKDSNIKYKPSKASYITSIMCIILIILMFIEGSSF